MVGKVTFGVDQLVENATAFIEAVVKARPSTVKGDYMKSLTISSTMGPGLRVDHKPFVRAAGGAASSS